MYAYQNKSFPHSESLFQLTQPRKNFQKILFTKFVPIS